MNNGKLQSLDLMQPCYLDVSFVSHTKKKKKKKKKKQVGYPNSNSYTIF